MEEPEIQAPPPPPPGPDPTPPTPSAGEAEPDFEPLEAEPGEADFEELTPPPPEPEPFTGEEIATGVMHLVVLGLMREFKDPAQVEAFKQAFMAAFPIMPTPAVLDALQVGEALAAYGIHKGMTGGPETFAALPPWLRIVLGGGYLAVAVYMGVRAAKEVNRGEVANPPGPVPDGAGLREEVRDAGPFQAAPAS